MTCVCLLHHAPAIDNCEPDRRAQTPSSVSSEYVSISSDKGKAEREGRGSMPLRQSADFEGTGNSAYRVSRPGAGLERPAEDATASGIPR
jgi:hypothetical protein